MRPVAPRATSGRAAKFGYALAAPLPLAIFIAHGLGGATSPQAGLWLVVAVSIGTLATWRAALPPSALLNYRPLYPAAACFIGLMAFVVWTVWQPSSGLRQASLAVLVGSSRVALLPDQTVLEAIRLIGLAVAVVGGFQLGSDPTRSRRTINLVLIFGLAWTLLSLGLFLAGGQTRLGRPFVSPNVAGSVLLCLLFLTLARTVRSLTRRHGRWLDRAVQATPYAAYAALLILCLILTASRSAIVLAAVLGPIMIGALSWRANSGRVPAVGAVIAFTLGLGALALTMDRGVLARLAETGIDASDRWTILGAYWSAFLQSPLYGFGLGSAPTLAKMSLTPDTYDALWNIRAVHNVYLQWLVEGGVIGTTLMLATVACLLAVAARNSIRGGFRSLAPLLAVDLVFLLQGLVDYSLQIPSVAMMWALLLGLQAAAVRTTRGLTAEHTE